MCNSKDKSFPYRQAPSDNVRKCRRARFARKDPRPTPVRAIAGRPLSVLHTRDANAAGRYPQYEAATFRPATWQTAMTTTPQTHYQGACVQLEKEQTAPSLHYPQLFLPKD